MITVRPCLEPAPSSAPLPKLQADVVRDLDKLPSFPPSVSSAVHDFLRKRVGVKAVVVEERSTRTVRHSLGFSVDGPIQIDVHIRAAACVVEEVDIMGKDNKPTGKKHKVRHYPTEGHSELRGLIEAVLPDGVELHSLCFYTD